MKKRFGKILSVFLCLCLIISLAGCNSSGKSSDDDNDEPGIAQDGGNDSGNYGDISDDNGDDNSYYDDGNNGDYSDNGDYNNDNDPYFVGGHDVTIYKAGNNTIAVEVKGSQTIRSDGDYLFMEIKNDNEEPLMGISLNLNYPNVSKVKKEVNGDMTSYSFEEVEGLGRDNAKTVLSDDLYFVTMSMDGAWDILPELSGTYELRRDQYTLARGKISDIFKTVSEEELSSYEASIYTSRKAENPAHDLWNGEYISTYYSVPAYIKIDVSESGIIHVHTLIKGEEKDYYGEEASYNEEVYDETTYISAGCSITNGYERIASLGYQSGYYDALTFYSYEEGYEYGTIELAKTNGPWHSKPDGYEDKDQFGEITDCINRGNACMKPATDDYLLLAVGGVNYGGFYAGGERYEVKSDISLYSFDTNRYAVQYVECYVFDDAAKASEAYNKRVAELDDYDRKNYEFALDNEYIYLTHNIIGNTNYAKMPMLSSKFSDEWYLDCHYAYSDQNSEYYHMYGYMSRPVTKDEYNMSILGMLYWQSMDYQLECTDNPKYTLIPDVNSFRTEFRVDKEGLTNEEYEAGYMVGGEDSYLRYHGDSAEGVRVWYSEYDDEGDVFIHEFTFTDTEITVTEKVYKFKGLANLVVTIDNYKSYTADEEYTHTFAVKERESQNYY